jgi:hypothetical protein
MNVELRRRRTSFLGEEVKAANDNARARPATSGPRALIYRPAKSAMTSGRAGTHRWILEFEPQSPPFVEPLMGWTGSTDPLAHMQLTFPSREAAVAFAKRQGWDYKVHNDETSRRAIAVVAQAQSLKIQLSPAELPLSPSDVEVGVAA